MVIRFEIDTLGNPAQVSIAGVKEDTLAKELAKMVTRMPKWRPATADDRPISTKFALPFDVSYRKIAVMEED